MIGAAPVTPGDVVDVLRPASLTLTGVVLDVARGIAVAGAAGLAGALLAAPDRHVPRPWLLAAGAGTLAELGVLAVDGGGPAAVLDDPRGLAALARLLLLAPVLARAGGGLSVATAVALLASVAAAAAGSGAPLVLALAAFQAAVLGWLGVLVAPGVTGPRRHRRVAAGLAAVTVPALVRVAATTQGGLAGAARDRLSQFLVAAAVLPAAFVLLDRRVLRRPAVTAAVLAAAAALAVVPLRSVPPAFTTTLPVGGASVVVTLAPARTGANELHLYLFDGPGAEIEDARAVLGGGEITLTQVGPNHLLTYDARVPSAGRWRLALDIRTAEWRLETATTIDVS